MEQTSISGASIQTQKASILKKDLLLSAVIGFLVALLLIPVLAQSDAFQKLNIKFYYVLALVIVLPILSAIGMLAAIFLAQKIRVMYQLAKFVLVGALNTFVDWGILNLLLYFADVTSGPLYSTFKGASFIVAVVNSYFWNKLWTFKKAPTAAPAGEEEHKSAGQEILQFFLVSVVGFALNVVVASLVVNYWGPQFGIGPKVWANVGALGGTIIGLAWNFLGYKLIVFKR